MKYRNDIDGLRAIAVMLVIVFHAGLSVFPAGFIGVDVFFVISGFLIANIIKNGIEQKAFSFTQFYLRRVWRLLPAMVTMILFAFVLASIFYLPADYAPFLKSVKQTFLIVSNRYFGKETSAYAAPDADSMLLLHTWSLSVEWQWYLIFPLAYYLLQKKVSNRSIMLCAPVLTLIALSITFHYTTAQPTKTYYFFASRLFEFLIGVSACLFMPKLQSLKLIIKNLLSLFSLGGIVYIAVQNGVIDGYPNGYTLAVAVFTAALIITGTDHKSLVNRVLSTPPLVYIGKTSYSLYLFHWPVFAVLHYIGYNGLIWRSGGIAVSVVLALGCYHLIETPLRKPRYGLLKTIALLIIAPLLFIIVFTSISKRFDEFSYIRFGSELYRINHTLESANLKQRQRCMNTNVTGTNVECTVGYASSHKKALLMGDSHANQYWNFFDIMGKDAHILVDMKATSLCLATPEVYHADLYLKEGYYYKTCHDNVEQYYKQIKSKKYDYVIIAQVWPNYANFSVRSKLDEKSTPDNSIKEIGVSTEKGIRLIIESGATPVLINTMQPMPDNYLTCFYEHFKTRGKYVHNDCNQDSRPARVAWVEQLFSNLKDKYPSLVIIDPKDVQCPNGVCKAEINGIPLYRDVGHLNDYATRMLGQEYLEKIGNPFKLQ
ncbi:acyltransferase family protein [Intestinirhabdus alba]|nr:acyltransferase family protein [Intestinirhabdus alba]